MERMNDAGARCTWSRCDIAVQEEVDRAMAAIHDEYRALDVVVNNAGFDVSGSFSRLSDEQWQKLVDVNLTGVMRVSRAVLAGWNCGMG